MFYVEVTCIHIDSVSKVTTLAHSPSGEAQCYRPLSDAIFRKVVSKTTQCSDFNAPCILGIGTFHGTASAICVSEKHIEFLHTGETSITMDYDKQKGHAVGEPYQTTRLKSAVCLKPSHLFAEPARKSISAVVIGGFGVDPLKLLGILHPAPAQEFDPAILDRIPFCSLVQDWTKGRLRTKWNIDHAEDVKANDGW